MTVGAERVDSSLSATILDDFRAPTKALPEFKLLSAFHKLRPSQITGAMRMPGKASTNEIWDTSALSHILTNWPQDDDIEHELCLVEDLILTLDAADAFIEDLISLHARRNALMAALSIHCRKRRNSLVSFDAWCERAETSHVANDCAAPRDLTTGAGEREPNRER